jgi:hypothetical protein
MNCALHLYAVEVQWPTGRWSHWNEATTLKLATAKADKLRDAGAAEAVRVVRFVREHVVSEQPERNGTEPCSP